MTRLAAHYLHQLGHVLAIRLAEEGRANDAGRLLLYRALSCRLEDCREAGVWQEATALMAAARRERNRRAAEERR